MPETSNLELRLVEAAQAQKHVTVNEALLALDALVQLAVASRSRTAPPPNPAEGERYIPAADATEAWSGRAGQIAAWTDGAWAFFAPRPGWLAFAVEEGRLLAFDGSAWIEALSAPPSTLQDLELLGIGTSADAANPFSAKLNKALWTARTAAEGGDGDLRYTLNKEQPTDVLSILLQSGFSARAELGLIGSEDLVLRVSPDGTTFQNVLSVDRSSGQALFDKGAMQVRFDEFTASGTWTKPAWARQIVVYALGGGGGGGGGRTGAAGSDRRGGGGGGAGGYNRAEWLADEVGPSLSVMVGAGGSPGAGSAAAGTNGAAGGLGGETLVLDDGVQILRAGGGNGGGGGTAATVVGGNGGAGSAGLANFGGAGGLTTGSIGASTTLGAGAGGGGGGGGINSANLVGSGGAGGFGHFSGGTGRRTAAPSGGAAGLGGNGGGGKAWARGAGSGGGGGGAGDAAGSANGGAGGPGGSPGGGGGGGGAATDGAQAGAGGAGGRGEVWFLSIG